jgi:hypothetical protein
MALRPETLNFNPHADTLVAVVLGALLATLSGIAANQIEAYFKRRERERSAALLFGEVISTLRVLLIGAESSRNVGDPYGPVTRRMLHTARREIDLYERNRESLLDLRDPALRVDIHSMMLRIAMPLDGILDSLVVGNPGDTISRDRGMEFMMDNVGKLPDIVARLGRIARHTFDQYGDRLGVGRPPVINDPVLASRSPE